MKRLTSRKSKTTAVLIVAGLIAMTASMAQAAFVHQSSNRVLVPLNRSWWFIGSDGSYSGTGLNDSTGSWTKVCLPQQNKTLKHMYFSGGTVLTGAGAEYQFTSWYRKHYNPPASYNGRKFLLEFEAVSIIATVYVNGTQVGTHSGGYTPFTIDITGQVTTGSDNVIAVKVDANRQTGIPPEAGNIDFCVFGGIAGNVNLIVVDPLHVEWNWVSIPSATSQTSTPSGTVTSHVKVVNNSAAQKTCTAITSIVDNTGNVITTGTGTAIIPAGGSSVITYAASSAVTRFWSPDDPYLYTVYTQLQDGTTYVDEHVDRTGFRTIWPMSRGTGYSGLYINGTRIKLFGLNRHGTFPYIGRAAPARIQRKDADILKYDLGCTMVRCSHYTQSPDFIRRCDEIGLMLIQEVPGWQNVGGGPVTTPTTWQGILMQGLKDMIIRDRNRPSIISFGVRVNESNDNDALYGPMNDTARALDPSRPTHGVRKSGTTSFLEDWWTQNFADPGTTQPWLTTESVGHNITPQIHMWDDDVHQMASGSQVDAHITQDNTTFGLSNSMGRLGWCAFDYNSPHTNATSNELLGTVDVTQRSKTPPYLSMHGVAGILRIPKIAGHFYQSQRNPATCGYMVYIANDRTNTSPTTVTVFSNCPTVELFRNGTSLGSKSGTYGPNLSHPAFQWAGVAMGGTLRAVGSAGGVFDQVSPPGNPTALVLTPDDSVIFDGGDMTRVVVSLVDTSGRPLRGRADSITMSAAGAGDFVGEARSALEGGQFAFYVKSRDGVFGTITASVSDVTTPAVTPGSATVRVVGATGVQPFPPPKQALAAGFAKPIYKRVWGSRFIVPPGIPENAHVNVRISVYDIAGKLLYKKATRPSEVIDIGKRIGASNAVYIVKIEAGKLPQLSKKL